MVLSLLYKHLIIMDIRYTWIYWQGNICLQFSLLILTSFSGHFVHPEVRGICILSSYEHSFTRVHYNLEQHPNNNITIIIIVLFRVVLIGGANLGELPLVLQPPILTPGKNLPSPCRVLLKSEIELVCSPGNILR